MTKDEIIKLAREAGSLVFQSNFYDNSFDFNSEQLERFAALVAAHERRKQAEQEPVEFEDALEAAYWEFDARVKGYGEWKLRRQTERDAFKWAVRGMNAAPVRTKDEK